jgi:hypothetical protein
LTSYLSFEECTFSDKDIEGIIVEKAAKTRFEAVGFSPCDYKIKRRYGLMKDRQDHFSEVEIINFRVRFKPNERNRGALTYRGKTES